MKKLFLVPANDGEAVEIRSLLLENGYEEGKNLFVTGQNWGASWGALETEIKDAIQGASGWGIELQGQAPEGFANIDHHTYDGDDRSNELSSLEQVAEAIGATLTVRQQFVAANDRGFIPAMERLGASIGMSQKELETMISSVRSQDRAAQGITPEQEEQAEAAIKAAEVDGSLTIVRLAHSKSATVTDRLYGQYQSLLVISDDGETNFFGASAVCAQLQKEFEGWSGGTAPNGFWGGYADQKTVEARVRELCK